MTLINNPAQPLRYQADKRVMSDEFLDLFLMEETTAFDANIYPWWPNVGSLIGDGALSDVVIPVSYDLPYPISGCNGRLSVVGFTRDSYGSPLGGCTVRLYLTSTGELITSVKSDANGAYTITSPYSAPHFITVHKSSPSVAGASIDTIVPA